MSKWLRRSVTVWLCVNGPAGVALLLAQTVGLPECCYYLSGGLLMLVLLPGTFIEYVVSGARGNLPRPDWYYTWGLPVGVILCNLPLYVGVGTAVGGAVRFLRWHEERRTVPERSLRLR